MTPGHDEDAMLRPARFLGTQNLARGRKSLDTTDLETRGDGQLATLIVTCIQFPITSQQYGNGILSIAVILGCFWYLLAVGFLNRLLL